MARQRPMSTKTGVPTAATYVFVNMLRKLVADFHPEYLAAVFDVAGPTFRDHQAAAVTSVRKFDMKTQTFKEVEYGGYKAQRAEMPADLAQQVPYIRRALEAYRIPILEYPGFEADDVLGTLAREGGRAVLSGVRGFQRQGHAAARQRQDLRAQSAEGQPDLRPRQGGRDSGRSAGAGGGRDGAARRRDRQHPRRARHRRQGIGGADPPLRVGRSHARTRRRGREEDLPRVAAQQPRHHPVQQRDGHPRPQRSGGARPGSDARRRARRRGRAPALSPSWNFPRCSRTSCPAWKWARPNIRRRSRPAMWSRC